MSSSATFSDRIIDKAIAIKRVLAIRSRWEAVCGTYGPRVRKTRFGLELARDFFLDRRYGGWCGGVLRTPFPELQSSRTQSTHYLQLMRLFHEVPIRESDVLVDVGCGKGRVINYWLHVGCKNQIVGIELNERVADWTRERLRRYPNVAIITGDVLDHIPNDATLFFLYHPFGERVMERFKSALRQTVRTGQDLRVIYYNCIHRNIFDDDPEWNVQDLTNRVVDKAILLRPRATEAAGGTGPKQAGPR
jgi:SAM-dependent methyltransferase